MLVHFSYLYCSTLSKQMVIYVVLYLIVSAICIFEQSVNMNSHLSSGVSFILYLFVCACCFWFCAVLQLEAVRADRARVEAVRAELDEQLRECEVELAHKQTKLAELMAYVEKTNDQLTQLNASNIQLQTTVRSHCKSSTPAESWKYVFLPLLLSSRATRTVETSSVRDQ